MGWGLPCPLLINGGWRVGDGSGSAAVVAAAAVVSGGGGG